MIMENLLKTKGMADKNVIVYFGIFKIKNKCNIVCLRFMMSHLKKCLLIIFSYFLLKLLKPCISRKFKTINTYFRCLTNNPFTVWSKCFSNIH